MASRWLVFYILSVCFSTNIAHESVARETAERLPDVNALLNTADETLVGFTAQAVSMQDRVYRAHKAVAVELAKQKASYDNNLTQQEADIHSTQAMNVRIQEAIDGIQKTSAGIKTETEALRGENSIMYKALKVLEDKVKAAEEFLSDSLNRTKNAGADPLQVLQSPTPEGTLVWFLSALHDEPPASFLQLSTRSKKRRRIRRKKRYSRWSLRESPSEFEEELPTVKELNQQLFDSLAEIGQEQKEGEAQLRAQFLGLYEAGKKQQNQLEAAHHALDDSKIVEERHKSGLKTARDHVLQTRSDLLKRLHGMEVFAKNLENAAADILSTIETTTLTTEPHEAISAGKLEVLSRSDTSAWRHDVNRSH